VLVRLLTAAAVLCGLALPAAPCAAMGAEGGAGEDGAIIVGHIATLSGGTRDSLWARAHVERERALPMPGVEVVQTTGTGPDAQAAALARLRADPSVAWAEPVRARHAETADALWSSLWALPKVDVPGAWAYGKGANATVAVVDSGVQPDHPDLQLTGNPAERGDGRETDGIDNDENGYVDDWQGWQFIAWTNDASDEFGHGTHVAGTIAATENAIGVVGVAPQARILPLRVLNRNGFGGSDSIGGGFGYAGDLGVRVVNASLGGRADSSWEQVMIRAHPETLYVVAAGNDSTRDPTNVPCGYPEDNILCVGASDENDERASFSNFGAPWIDLFAPGTDIWSTWFDGGYIAKNGTSMATPHVAGVAALMFAAVPGLTVAQVKTALMDASDHPPGMAELSVSGGRLNAAAALAAVGATVLPPEEPEEPSTTDPGSTTVPSDTTPTDTTTVPDTTPTVTTTTTTTTTETPPWSTSTTTAEPTPTTATTPPPSAVAPTVLPAPVTATAATTLPVTHQLALRAGARRLGNALLILTAATRIATLSSPAALVAPGTYRVSACIAATARTAWRCRASTRTLRRAGMLPVVSVRMSSPALGKVRARVTVQRRHHGRLHAYATTRTHR
jgi:thermitase